ncbi:unnamed protein product [Commensalibacter communis]|uniref:Uncharacterized protein n=2 Tax=Commensalibacter communis TaxID=2972786 RepID=A0A9W4TQA3_9PROT|nr:hypothetical protein [Commensalibacter communis]CAI3927296.1 unnamed protein product [Commensalibacter communis]CAI3927897.1 unnamed protein product [Commensalibacter communis]CAI3933563.1 unnamed protein product [Commensalibacter communis]CAI3935124.1 unnamed protein product [Commensalibacter communis]
MNYVNTFISQSNILDFLNFLHGYFHKETQKHFLFELVFSTDQYSEYFFNKYQNKIQKHQVIDEENMFFNDDALKDIEFIKDIQNDLINNGYLIIHIFYDIIDLIYIYEHGFENTLNNEVLRFEISKLNWEIIQLPNPYLYADQLSEDVYQQIADNYDLFNLGQSTISLRKPWHITLNYMSNKIYSDKVIFDKKNEDFAQFNQIISDISK